MSFRRDFVTKPIFSWARGVLPAMSDTEREALEAGTSGGTPICSPATLIGRSC